MTKTRISILFLILFLSFAGTCQAGYEQGVAAYKKGDYATAFSEFLVLAEAGHDSSQYNLGLMYAKGQYVAQDFYLARKWFTQAAALGHPMAQGSLGVMFAQGQGGDKNLAEAKYWLDTALANPRTPEAYKKTAKQALSGVTAEISPDDLERAKMFAIERPPIISPKKYKMSSTFMQNPEGQQMQPPANYLSPDFTMPVKPETRPPAEPERTAASKPDQAVPAKIETNQKAEPEKTAVAQPDATTPDDEDQNVSGTQDETQKAKSGGKHKKKSKKKSKDKKSSSKKTHPKEEAQP